jgi:hypothetical protein
VRIMARICIEAESPLDYDAIFKEILVQKLQQLKKIIIVVKSLNTTFNVRSCLLLLN